MVVCCRKNGGASEEAYGLVGVIRDLYRRVRPQAVAPPHTETIPSTSPSSDLVKELARYGDTSAVIDAIGGPTASILEAL